MFQSTRCVNGALVKSKSTAKSINLQPKTQFKVLRLIKAQGKGNVGSWEDLGRIRLAEKDRVLAKTLLKLLARRQWKVVCLVFPLVSGYVEKGKNKNYP